MCNWTLRESYLKLVKELENNIKNTHKQFINPNTSCQRDKYIFGKIMDDMGKLKQKCSKLIVEIEKQNNESGI